jgi:hypothetical protein
VIDSFPQDPFGTFTARTRIGNSESWDDFLASGSRSCPYCRLLEQALDDEDLQQIATLDKKTSSFFSHRDPAMVKWMSERRLELDPPAAS